LLNERDQNSEVEKIRPIAIDFFCGAGGLSLGFKRGGFKIAAAFDSDPIHVKTHAINFPESTSICADVSALCGKQVRALASLSADLEIDVIIGGPPCQGFSMIGKRNMEDPRNLLLLQFCRLIVELSPKYFVIENVSGLKYGAARKILAKALRYLKKAGYCWVSPIQIVNASDFGVPQRRKRVFILGYRRGLLKPTYPNPTMNRTTVKEAIGDLRGIGRTKALFSSDLYFGKLGAPSRYARKLRLGSRNGKLTGCLRAVHTPIVVRRFKVTKPGEQERISRFVRLNSNSVAPTLRAGTAKEYGGFTAARPIHPTQHRCITVREAARLHSFPDRFVFNPTQWHGFRQVGNSVPPELAKHVAKKIRSALES
jgi:DNA (cytosine-5)-methyltransferase 1